MLSSAPPRCPVSPTKELGHTSGISFCGCFPEDTCVDGLALVASGACVNGFNGMVANNEAVLNWLSHQDSKKKPQIELPMSECIRILTNRLRYMSEGPVSNQTESGCYLGCSPQGHWQVLAYPKLQKATKNEVGCLDHHKALRDNPEVGKG